jgi:hypothetical protein
LQADDIGLDAGMDSPGRPEDGKGNPEREHFLIFPAQKRQQVYKQDFYAITYTKINLAKNSKLYT